MKPCQFLQQRNRSMWNSRCFGALKFEHHYETVVAAEVHESCCLTLHVVMNVMNAALCSVIEMFDLLLLFFSFEPGRKQKTPKKFTGEQPSISGTFGLKGNTNTHTRTHIHTRTHTHAHTHIHVLYNGEDLPWLLLFLKSKFWSIKATKDLTLTLYVLHFMCEKIILSLYEAVFIFVPAAS